jgi:hypothetical protein
MTGREDLHDLHIDPFLPRTLPPGWRQCAREADGVAYYGRASGLAVIFSVGVEPDGRRWLHLSVSRRSRIPSWHDLRLAKDVFLGPDRAAYQVLPRESEYVNHNPFVLHLWSCLDGDPLPDFRRAVGGLLTI